MKLPHKKIRAYVNSASYSIRNVSVVTLFLAAADSTGGGGWGK